MPEFTLDEIRAISWMAMEAVDKAVKCRSYLPERYEKASALSKKILDWQREMEKAGD